MYIIRSEDRNDDPDSKLYKYHAYLIKLQDGQPVLMYGYRTSQLLRYPMTFTSNKDAEKYFELVGIHRLDLWLRSNNLVLARVRESKAIPELGEEHRKYRSSSLAIKGASAMLRKALSDAGYATMAQIIYDDVGKVLYDLRLQYNDTANRIAGKHGRVRRVEKC